MSVTEFGFQAFYFTVCNQISSSLRPNSISSWETLCVCTVAANVYFISCSLKGLSLWMKGLSCFFSLLSSALTALFRRESYILRAFFGPEDSGQTWWTCGTGHRRGWCFQNHIPATRFTNKTHKTCFYHNPIKFNFFESWLCSYGTRWMTSCLRCWKGTSRTSASLQHIYSCAREAFKRHSVDLVNVNALPPWTCVFGPKERYFDKIPTAIWPW